MYGRAPQSSYRLANKLRQEYRGRGESLRGIRAASTEELVARAQMGRDPDENVSEEAFSDRLRDRNFTYQRTQQKTYAGQQNPQQRYSGTASHYHSGQRKNSAAGNRSGNAQNRRSAPKEKMTGEVQVRTRTMPVGYLVMLAAVTMMIVTILFSIAQIYQTTNSIADLERELSALQTTASELELAIEEKNDIRTIEQIATDQLGMVKEDSVQRKYISLSDGERIDIIGEEETISDSGFGTMLSSIASALAGFFENLGR